MAHLSFIHTTMKRFDEDQARHARITRLPGDHNEHSREKRMIISAASDYRAAAQRILPPFLFHYMDGGHILNTPYAATWKICQKWRCASVF